MPNKLSHSALNRFKMCSMSYKLHYLEKIRPIGTTGPLIFGAALDSALNALLTDKNEFAEATFGTEFTTQKINGKEVYLPTCSDISYTKTDFDADLITEVDAEWLKKQAAESGLQEYSDHLSTYKRLKKQETFTEQEKRFYNLANWISLYRKGLLMIHAYRTKILPYIEKVYAVQKEFSLGNNEGDSVVGLVDLIADIKDIGTVILDNKTASRPYEKDSVLKSEQLSLYVHALEDEYKTRKAGYIVLNKNVAKNRTKICSVCGYDGSGATHTTCSNKLENGKRCQGAWNETIDPEIRVQVIVDDIPEQMEATVLAEADEVNIKISCGEFGQCDIQQCENWFGQKCCYYNYCHSGRDMTGLIKMEKK